MREVQKHNEQSRTEHIDIEHVYIMILIEHVYIMHIIRVNRCLGYTDECIE